MVSGRYYDEILAFFARVEDSLTYAYQPIVSVTSGQVYGYEALLRGWDSLGFADIGSVFDQAHADGTLHRLEMALRRKALAGFSRFALPGQKLFFNIDNRVLESPDYVAHRTAGMLETYNLSPTSLCLELSERHVVPRSKGVDQILRAYRRQSYLIAIDDFGAGFSGLQLLYEQQPNLVKIDRYFMDGLAKDTRKKLFVSTIVNLAHVLGIIVVGEGIETEADFRAAQQIGCDLIQGYFVARPTQDLSALQASYPLIIEANRRERRARLSDHHLLREGLANVPPVQVDDPVESLFRVFRQQREHDFVPVVDEAQRPVGIVHERDLKEVLYSAFGRDLLANKSLRRGILDFVRPCPMCDIFSDTEMILATYSQAPNPVGVMLVENLRYVGVLTTSALLRVINEKNLASARDQNPLTRMPGNNAITGHIMELLDRPDTLRILVYFDLDNFKPFNDHFGFRQGDRALLLFSELLQAHFGRNTGFVGHIGGDDFFAAPGDQDEETLRTLLDRLLTQFRQHAESFYDAESRARGYILGKDRQGEQRRFPLLSASAAAVILPPAVNGITVDDIVNAIASLKQSAKQSPDHIAFRILDWTSGMSTERGALLA